MKSLHAGGLVTPGALACDDIPRQAQREFEQYLSTRDRCFDRRPKVVEP